MSGQLVTSDRLTVGKIVADRGSEDWHHRKLRDWLLLLLRFAVTRELLDKTAAFAAADELDSLGLHWRPDRPNFFLRTKLLNLRHDPHGRGWASQCNLATAPRTD